MDPILRTTVIKGIKKQSGSILCNNLDFLDRYTLKREYAGRFSKIVIVVFIL